MTKSFNFFSSLISKDENNKSNNFLPSLSSSVIDSAINVNVDLNLDLEKYQEKIKTLQQNIENVFTSSDDLTLFNFKNEDVILFEQLRENGFYFGVEADILTISKIVDDLCENICYFDFNLNDPLSKSINSSIVHLKDSMIFEEVQKNELSFFLVCYFYIITQEKPYFDNDKFSMFDSVADYLKTKNK